MSIGTYLRNEIAGPLGAEFFIGLPPAQEPRVARLVSFLDGARDPAGTRAGAAAAPPAAGPAWPQLAELAEYLPGPRRATAQGPERPRRGALRPGDLARPRRCTQAEIPAANGICDARSWPVCTAPVWTTCRRRVGDAVPHPRAPQQVDRAVQQQTEGPDVVLMGLDLQWGLGFNVNTGLIAAGRPGWAPRLRALRHGWIGGMGRPRSPSRHGLRHEQDGDRHDRRHPELPAHAGLHRRATAREA